MIKDKTMNYDQFQAEQESRMAAENYHQELLNQQQLEEVLKDILDEINKPLNYDDYSEYRGLKNGKH
jgi:hypothetical protein